eukprot:c47543_g1_i1 orf=112-297(-)
MHAWILTAGSTDNSYSGLWIQGSTDASMSTSNQPNNMCNIGFFRSPLVFLNVQACQALSQV